MTTMSANQEATPRVQSAGRLMVDAPTRVFHWVLALSFVGAYVTSESEHWRLIHITLGYTALGMLAFRLLWAILGPRSVRWSTWRSRLQAAFGQVREWHSTPWKWSTKLVALNTLAIMALFVAFMLTVTSGVALDQEWWGDALEEVHEVLGNGLLVLVAVHLGLVLLSAWVRAGLPWKAMVSGRVSGSGPDLVPMTRRWLAALMLALVAGFWYWQWQTAPSAPQGSDGVTWGHAGERDHARAEHDDDDDD